MLFNDLETAQHPSDLTLVFDRSPFKGRFRIFASILWPTLVHQKPFVPSVVNPIPSCSWPTLVPPLTLGWETLKPDQILILKFPFLNEGKGWVSFQPQRTQRINIHHLTAFVYSVGLVISRRMPEIWIV